MAMQPDGGFGVVWYSFDSAWDTDRSSIEARLFFPDGSPRAAEGPVNTYTTDVQKNPAVAVNGDGNFIVVVWESYGSSGNDDDGASVQAQLYIRPLFLDGFEAGDTSAWSSTMP